MRPRTAARWRARSRDPRDPRGWASAATLALVGAWLAAPALPSAATQTLAASALLLLGVPHGGLDLWLARRRLSPGLGSSWAPVFATAYLALAAAVVVGWAMAPAAALLAFLVISVLHFGSGDRVLTRSGPVLGTVEVLMRGAVPTLVPLLAHPEQAAGTLGVLASVPPRSVAGVLALAGPVAAGPMAVGAGLVAGACLLGRGTRDGRRALGAAFELPLLALAAVALPPLLSFAAYFCLWHAPRHVLHLRDRGVLPAGGRAWRDAALATGAALGLGLGAFLLLAQGVGPEVAWLRTLFVGLAALTVPHVLLGLSTGAGAPLCGAGPGPRPDAAQARSGIA